MTVAPFKNQHLSFSRLARFEQCQKSYFLHYVEKRQAEPGLLLRFGKTLHAVLEQLVKEAVEDGRSRPLSESRAFELYREAWAAEQITGMERFAEGLNILRDFLRDQGVIEPRDILGIEQEFRLSVGPFTVLGFIDRVDRIDDETVNVIDYKSNHQLFARDEVDTSLQLSLYNIAAKQLWPWAKKVKLTFWMLRHGIRQETTRTDEQLADALAYIEMLGHQTETASEFPARLNANCSYCDHRRNCDAYEAALTGKREFLCEDLADLVAVAREREEVARLAKVLYARKEELEDILKVHLQDRDQLDLEGVRYRLLTTASHEYPLEPTITLLSAATGKSKEALVDRLVTIDKRALGGVLDSLGKTLDKPRVALLKAELDAHATTKHSTRFWAKEVA